MNSLMRLILFLVLVMMEQVLQAEPAEKRRSTLLLPTLRRAITLFDTQLISACFILVLILWRAMPE